MNQPLQQNDGKSGIVLGPDYAKNQITQDLPGTKRGKFAEEEMADQDPVNRVTLPVESAKTAFLEWEKLRLAYNVVLLALVLGSCACFFGWSSFRSSRFWFLLGFYGFMANVCFCVGPWIEGWLAVAGANRRLVRWILFLPGMLFAFALAAVAMLSWHLPPWVD